MSKKKVDEMAAEDGQEIDRARDAVRQVITLTMSMPGPRKVYFGHLPDLPSTGYMTWTFRKIDLTTYRRYIISLCYRNKLS
jgi:hypothetical protein